jgi:predicted transglutaminase-like cysteine proteinase
METSQMRFLDDIHKEARDRIEYRPDRTDEWASPADTLARGFGDCEDICIFERALLINAGFNANNIELMIVEDLVTRQTHALLWVSEYFLDNRAEKSQYVDRFKDFRPITGHRARGSYLYGRVL